MEKLAGPWPALIALAQTEGDSVFKCEALLVTVDLLIWRFKYLHVVGHKSVPPTVHPPFVGFSRVQSSQLSG